jgi:RNA polymerase sigma-70 factor, ECF subfamily
MVRSTSIGLPEESVAGASLVVLQRTRVRLWSLGSRISGYPAGEESIMDREQQNALIERLVAKREWMVEELMRMGVSNHYADDAMQDAFMKLIDEVREKRGPRQTEVGWVMKIAWRAFLDELRKQARETRARSGRQRFAESDLTRTVEEPAEEAIPRKVLVALAAEKKSLTLKQTDVVELYFYKGLTIAEIARSRSLPRATVAGRLARALSTLHKALSKYESDVLP